MSELLTVNSAFEVNALSNTADDNLGAPDDVANERVIARYADRNRTKRYADNIVYEFTRDKALLHQYFDIYRRECRVVNYVEAFLKAEEECNKNSHILIARIGNLCIGGARLTVSSPRRPQKLPVEINGFRLKDYFPVIEHKQMQYGELSRLVLLPEFRTGDLARSMFWHLYRKAVAVNLDIGFAAAPLVNIKAYKRNFSALGLKQSQIHEEIDVPPYPGFEEVKDYLLSLVVDKSLVKKSELIFTEEMYQ